MPLRPSGTTSVALLIAALTGNAAIGGGSYAAVEAELFAQPPTPATPAAAMVPMNVRRLTLPISTSSFGNDFQYNPGHSPGKVNI